METFYKLLKDYRLQEAIQCAKSLPSNELFGEICTYIDGNPKNMLWYPVITELLTTNETAGLHNLIFFIFDTELNFVDGAPFISLYHARKAVELSNESDPDFATYLTNLLILNSEPDHMVSDEEANQIAKKVLELNPTNEFVIKKMNSGHFK